MYTCLFAVLLRQKDASRVEGLNRNKAVHLHCMLLHSASSLIRPVQQLLRAITLLVTLIELDGVKRLRLGRPSGALIPCCFDSSSTVPPTSAAATLAASVSSKATNSARFYHTKLRPPLPERCTALSSIAQRRKHVQSHHDQVTSRLKLSLLSQ
jgi:hypothetical protein